MIHSANDDPAGSGSETMRYGMLGADLASAGEKLAKYTGEAGWEALRPHFQSGALLYVDPALSLTEVGLAFSRDDRAAVEGWLKTGDVLKPGAAHAAWWESSGARFTALVVSPFVLCQPLG